jgi:peptidoglycan lytic transglycosylase B
MLPATFALFLALSPSVHQRVAYVVDQLTQNGFSRREARALFRDRRLKTYPPVEVAPHQIDWDGFIASLVTADSVERGVEFLSQNRSALSQAEQRYGVEKEVLTALLRVESNLGKNTGRYVTFNVFYTSLVRSTEEFRWKRAAENLVSLAVYCKRSRESCFQIQGSYGGALGPAQFLPHTLEIYGCDGNGDGIVDPFQTGDAICSAANFLVQNGWREDQTEALGKYYGVTEGYPRAVLAYAETLRRRMQADSLCVEILTAPPGRPLRNPPGIISLS